MSDDNGADTIGLATALAMGTALRSMVMARVRLARRQIETRFRLFMVAVVLGLVSVAILGIAVIFALNSVAIGLQIWGLTPAMAMLATAGLATVVALILLLIASICFRRAVNGPNT